MPNTSDQQADALDALSDAVRAIGGVLGLEDVLQIIVDRVRSLVGSRYAALGIAGDRGAIERFITSGVTPDERAAIGPIPVGHGLLGLIIREGHSFRIPDIAAHPDSYGFPPNHPPMRSFLGVPIRLRDEVFGNLYLTDKQSGEVFTDVDEELVVGLASAASVAIENARLHTKLH
jgi:GAF domain-containing protein